jgi:hypothetical protein
MKKSAILKYVSIIVGALATLTLVVKSPVIITIDGIAAVLYFLSIFLKKKGL